MLCLTLTVFNSILNELKFFVKQFMSTKITKPESACFVRSRDLPAAGTDTIMDHGIDKR